MCHGIILSIHTTLFIPSLISLAFPSIYQLIAMGTKMYSSLLDTHHVKRVDRLNVFSWLAGDSGMSLTSTGNKLDMMEMSKTHYIILSFMYGKERKSDFTQN